MKKLQLVLTLAALLLAGAGVFATSSKPAISQRIDSNGDGTCDLVVSSLCDRISGQNCSYLYIGTMKTVHDFNANCQLLYKQ